MLVSKAKTARFRSIYETSYVYHSDPRAETESEIRGVTGGRDNQAVRGDSGRGARRFDLRVALCLLLALLMGPLAPLATVALAEGTDGGKAIAIAYDNSGSMFQGRTSWNAAEYSAEVLAAMLNEKDSLAIFAMDSPGMKIGVEGSQKGSERVKAIHENGLGQGGDTYTRPAEEALAYLKTVNEPEKYLVIMTDGQFQGDGIQVVQSIANEAVADGMQVEYLAIGDEAVEIAGDAAGVSVEHATSGNILEVMTKIANRIFGRAPLLSEYVDLGAGRIDLPVPMENLIIFAQGQNVAVGPITGDGSTIEAREAVSVKRADVPYPGADASQYAVDDRLQGVVATYGAVPAGSYQIDVSGAESVAIYYKPDVKISVALTDQDGESCDLSPNGSNELFAGTFTPTFTLLDPNTDQPMASNLLEPATYSLLVTQNGTSKVVHPGDSFQLSKGTADFKATADTAGGAQANEDYPGVTVSATPVNLRIDASSLPDRIGVADFADASYPVTVTHEDGSPLTPQEWDALEPSVADSSGIVWTSEKSDDGKTIIVRPTYGDGDEWATEQALFGFGGFMPNHPTEVRVSAQAEVGDTLYQGHVAEPVTYTWDILDVMAHDLKWLVPLIAAIVYLIFWLNKPRLPRKMHPVIDVGGTGANLVRLKYSDGKIRHRDITLRAESTEFRIVPKIQAEALAYPFNTMFGLRSIGIVATRKKRGRRQFYLDKKTIDAMQRLNSQPGSFPMPNFAPIDSPGTKPGKGLTYTAGSNISFQGWDATGKNQIPFMLKFK